MYFREILKNNIYGVDLNEESVEITKLSLWLKSAVRGKKLQTLDDNIKCGNSLIDDPAVAGEKAFNWNSEFADIMASGGFDVIVGNPPYIFLRSDNMSEKEKTYYRSYYQLYKLKPRTDIYFFEKTYSLLSKDGYV
jgi:type I restriction-modification system DNA methylase subunit